MAERLHGPWRLTATKADNGVRERFVITGSSASDGRHEVQPGTPARLDVGGAQWEVGLEVRVSNRWEDVGPLERSTQVAPGVGLTIRLSVGSVVDRSIIDPLSTLKLTLVSRDPVINPPPIPNPFDFSLPGD